MTYLLLRGETAGLSVRAGGLAGDEGAVLELEEVLLDDTFGVELELLEVTLLELESEADMGPWQNITK